MNIRQTLSTPIGDLAASGFKGRKPGSGAKVKGLNSQGLMDAAKKMWGDGGDDFNIHMERSMRSEAPHMKGPMKFESLTKTQRRNVAKNLYSTAQTRQRAARMKLKASPSVYGGGPGSGPQKGGGQDPKTAGKHEVSVTFSDPKVNGGKKFTRTTTLHGPDKGTAKHMLHTKYRNAGYTVHSGGPGSGPQGGGQVNKDTGRKTYYKPTDKEKKERARRRDGAKRMKESRKKHGDTIKAPTAKELRMWEEQDKKSGNRVKEY